MAPGGHGHRSLRCAGSALARLHEQVRSLEHGGHHLAVKVAAEIGTKVGQSALATPNVVRHRAEFLLLPGLDIGCCKCPQNGRLDNNFDQVLQHMQRQMSEIQF